MWGMLHFAVEGYWYYYAHRRLTPEAGDALEIEITWGRHPCDDKTYVANLWPRRVFA